MSALKLEDKVGTMLPCNVVVQDTAGGAVEVAAIDPVASMLAIDNPFLKKVAEEVRERLKKAIARLYRDAEKWNLIYRPHPALNSRS